MAKNSTWSAVKAPGLAGALETTLYPDGQGREAVERSWGDVL